MVNLGQQPYTPGSRVAQLCIAPVLHGGFPPGGCPGPDPAGKGASLAGNEDEKLEIFASQPPAAGSFCCTPRYSCTAAILTRTRLRPARRLVEALARPPIICTARAVVISCGGAGWPCVWQAPQRGERRCRCCVSRPGTSVVQRLCVRHSCRTRALWILPGGVLPDFRGRDRPVSATENPYDKAGAYGIRGHAALWVDRIEGDYYTIMGLPVSRTMFCEKQSKDEK